MTYKKGFKKEYDKFNEYTDRPLFRNKKTEDENNKARWELGRPTMQEETSDFIRLCIDLDKFSKKDKEHAIENLAAIEFWNSHDYHSLREFVKKFTNPYRSTNKYKAVKIKGLLTEKLCVTFLTEKYGIIAGLKIREIIKGSK